jgi:DNA-binding IclR family transcriptional regulator
MKIQDLMRQSGHAEAVRTNALQQWWQLRQEDARMRLVLNTTSPRLAFQFGHRNGLRAADELVDQLAEQLRQLGHHR